MEICAAIAFPNKLYTRFPPGRLIPAFLTDRLTGSTEELIISVSELRRFVVFLMIKPYMYNDKLLAYPGDNKNVSAWIEHRTSSRALARFLSRILSGIEHKYRFQVRSLYISSLNNTYCDRLTRFPAEQSQLLAQQMGWEFAASEPL